MWTYGGEESCGIECQRCSSTPLSFSFPLPEGGGAVEADEMGTPHHSAARDTSQPHEWADSVQVS